MVRANLFRAAALALIAVLAGTHTIGLPVLYAVFLTVGIAETFFDNAAQAFLPHLVTSAQLPTANSRMYGGEIVANQFAGPPLGGILFGVAVALPFALDGATLRGRGTAHRVDLRDGSGTDCPRRHAPVRPCGTTSPKVCATCSGTRCSARWRSCSA